MTASLLFINMLEEALEKGEVLHTCSWDITRAFDSVSKNIMKMAWARLGVPQEWANWLVQLDDGGMTVVRTPHAIKVWNEHGRAGFKSRAKTRKKKRRPDYGAFERFVYNQRPPNDEADEIQGDDADEWTNAERAAGFISSRGTG